MIDGLRLPRVRAPPQVYFPVESITLAGGKRLDLLTARRENRRFDVPHISVRKVEIAGQSIGLKIVDAPSVTDTVTGLDGGCHRNTKKKERAPRRRNDQRPAPPSEYVHSPVPA
jgi:hypothetical protein